MQKNIITRRKFLSNILKGTAITTLLSLSITNTGCPDQRIVNDYKQLEYNLNGEIKNFGVNFYYKRGDILDGAIIFSHGFGVGPKNHLDLINNFALNGYLVVAPEHNDYLLFRPEDGIFSFENLQRIIPDAERILESIRQIPEYSDISLQEVISLFSDILFSGAESENIEDISNDLFYNRRIELEKSIEAGINFLNSENAKIGLIGYSLGGNTVLELSSEKGYTYPKLFLSPVSGFSKASELKGPSRWITGNLDVFYQQTFNAYDKAPSPSSFINLKDVGHATFARDICLIGNPICPTLEIISNNTEPIDFNCVICDDYIEKLRVINSASLAFFNQRLKSEGFEGMFSGRFSDRVLEYYRKNIIEK